MLKDIICVSVHRKGPVVSEDQNCFLIFPKWLFCDLNFGAKFFEIGHCNAFLRYGDFIEDVITDW